MTKLTTHTDSKIKIYHSHDAENYISTSTHEIKEEKYYVLLLEIQEQ